MIEPMTKKQLAELAGYTYRRLYDIDRALDEKDKLFKDVGGGKCDPAFFVQNWLRYNVERERGEDLSLEEQKALHEKHKTRKTQLEVLRMEGAMVDVDDVRKLWDTIAATVMQNMLQLPAKIAPNVAGMESIEAIAAVMDGEIRKVLEQIADTPLPEYAWSTTDSDEAEED